MKTLKLVVGILAIVLAAFVMFQSCAATALDAMTDGDGVSGFSGTIVAIALLAGGIVLIATRKATGKGGDIACIVLMVLAAIIGFAGAGFYEDLKIWSVVCLIIAVICVVSLILNGKKAKTEIKEATE